ncbi:MAG TPA: glycosyltransferase [Solirubrobacteraceae bacterium]|nr:glycosyltransferase [Solirubrobacteraceae bacterium]
MSCGSAGGAGGVGVGVIVPVHGWAPYLAETLDAILGEQPAEVVVVDDGSPTPVRLGPSHASACRLVRHQPRRGLAGARAAGLAVLETRFVALCDADDVWEPGSLGLRVAGLGQTAAACFGAALIVGPDGRPTGEEWIVPDRLELPELFERNPLCVSSVVLRRDALLAAGGLHSDLPRAEDWELWLRLLGRGERLVHEPAAVVRYRRRAGALSGDIASLARAQLELHARHAGLVCDEIVERVRAADLRALAAGLVRQRRYGEAADALRAAGASPLAATIPGVRALRGRRDPYRRR